MSLHQTCARCAASLPDDAPEGAVCAACESARASGATVKLFGSEAFAPASTARGLESFGDFEIVNKLGQGGMGAVYRARQRTLDRLVALKVLPTQFTDDAESVSRFQREARVASSLTHPNLVRVFGAGESDGCHYIVMELVEGENLHQRMKRERLPLLEALRVCTEVARGLQCGWDSAQLIHRDIKPSNIYLSHSGEVKLGDLGLAKSLLGNTTGLTQTGTMMGTPYYMSPEQARADKHLDFRADIYSLGCTLYELLTGQPPYGGDDAITIINQHINAPLPAILKVLPQCPIPVARLVGKMLKKAKHERHASYPDLIAEFERVCEQVETGSSGNEASAALVAGWRDLNQGTPAAPRPASRPTETTSAKSKFPLYAGVGAVVLVVAGLAFVLTKPAKRKTGAPVPVASAQRTDAPPAPARLSPAAEPWQDVLRDPAKLVLSGALERTPEGLRFTAAGSATLPPGKAPQRDGAVRLRTTFGGLRPFVRARWSADAGNYQLAVNKEGTAIVLGRVDAATVRTVLMQQFPLREPLQAGQDYELELRLAGQTLTAKFNGEILGTATHGTFTEGQFGAAVADRDAPPALVKSLEVLDLDANAAAKATVTAEPWQDVLRDPAHVVLNNGALHTPEGLVFSAVNSRALIASLPESQRTGAIRMRRTYDGVGIKLMARVSPKGHYGVAMPNAGTIAVERYERDTRESTILRAFHLASPLAIGADFDFEFRVVGSVLTVKLNGQSLGSVEDATFAQGQFSVQTSDRNVQRSLVKSLEVLDLDAQPPAAATKDAPFVNTLGMKFVPVPITGGPTAGKRVLFSVWETRVQDYEVFAKEVFPRELQRAWPKPNFVQTPTHPAVNMTWENAQDFCLWLTHRERKAGRLEATLDYRLPTDHEWSCAVGLAEREDAAKSPREKNSKFADVFPWGAPWPPPPRAGNYRGSECGADPGVLPGYDDGFKQTAPVGSFDPTALGLFDLSGNVTEWCEDLFDPSAAGAERVQRGSAFVDGSRATLLSSYRIGRTTSADTRGFRVVLALAP